MIPFQAFITEQTVELSTTKAKELKKDLEAKGFKVTSADDEGLVIKTNDVKKLQSWMLNNGWDKQDIKDLF